MGAYDCEFMNECPDMIELKRRMEEGAIHSQKTEDLVDHHYEVCTAPVHTSCAKYDTFAKRLEALVK